MAHFMFYAGRAYDYKIKRQEAKRLLEDTGFFPFLDSNTKNMIIKQSNINPVSEAIQDGYLQERSDQLFAPHSAFSYEDLPSDKYGAIFGAIIFDENSSLSFGEQLNNYLNSLGATNPQNAPNYNNLPSTELNKPSRTNRTTTPVYTKDNH